MGMGDWSRTIEELAGLDKPAKLEEKGKTMPREKVNLTIDVNIMANFRLFLEEYQGEFGKQYKINEMLEELIVEKMKKEGFEPPRERGNNG